MLDQTTSTLATALATLKKMDGLTDQRRRDLVSAITRCASFLGKPPGDLTTDAPALREALAKLHPKRLGIKPKSLANVKTNLARALQLTGHLPPDDPEILPTRAWKSVIAACEQEHQRHVIARFIRYCCNRGIEPAQVDDTIVTGFREFLDERVLGRDPAKTCKKMTQFWNGLNKRRKLGLATLTYDKGGRYRARPLTEYPKGLQDEIAAYIDSLAEIDLFDETGPDQPLKPTSLRNIQAHLRQYLDALVEAGQEAKSITNLRQVVSAEHMKLAFRVIMRRMSKDEPPPTLNNIAATLKAYAKYRLKLSPEDLAAIEAVAKRVKHDPKGMSQKNKDRLRQFEDWRSVLNLIELPHVLMQAADDMPIGRDASLNAMYAVAIAILMAAPMRIKNVAALRLDKHVLAKREGRRTIYMLRIPDTEVKNGVPIEMRLNAKTGALLRRYLDVYRARLTSHRGDALFPRPSDGEPRKPGNLGQAVGDRIAREIGLDVNPHLFRHVSAFLFLRENPGEYETVRRLLGHKKLQTTMDFYAEISTQAAHDRYDEAVLSRFGRST